MIHRRHILAVLLVASALAAESRAEIVPLPRAYYDFENIVGGEVFRNKMNPGYFDGYLGTSSSDATRNPQVGPGLFGSGQALKFSSNQIARVPSLVTDVNSDRLDEDVFSGAFTVFARVDTANVAQMNVVNADRGPLSTTVRGWYLDFCDCGANSKNGLGDYLLRPRFTTGGGPYLLANGTETTNYQNVESIAVTWIPDPNPGGAAEGQMEIYVNGLLYASKAHNSSSVYVGEAGFNIGFGEGVSWGNGITIDDVAIWDVALTEAQILDVHIQGAPVPEPATFALLGMGLAAVPLCGRRRRRRGSRQGRFMEGGARHHACAKAET